MLPGAMAMAATRQVDYPQTEYLQTEYPQARGPQPQPIQPSTHFDALFRQPGDASTPHSQTRLMPPVDADYRMAPPPGTAGDQGRRGSFEAGPGAGYQGGAPNERQYPPGAGAPPGEDEEWYDDEPSGVRKPIVWGTVGAVLAAGAVILGLLYLGNHNNTAAANSAASSPAATSAATGSPSPSVGDINLPPGMSSASASASASASSSAATGDTNLPLTIGSTGKYVTYVQNRLRQLHYYHGAATGQYDQATAQAVIQFQAAAQVNGDPAGTVGRSTLTALIAAGTRPNLRPGSNDSGDVKRLQEALNSAQNAGLQVNGRYDAATAEAVQRYQSSVGAPQTGTANGQTWAALQSGSVA
jgi:peptidoglycan hydrolase-like protein with peptidoglycan-binding domain